MEDNYEKISRRSFLKASAVLGSAAALTACGGSSASTSNCSIYQHRSIRQHCSSQRDTIKIGTIYAMSGGNAAIGENILRGIDFAVDEINKAGGVNGQMLEVVRGDHAATQPPASLRQSA